MGLVDTTTVVCVGCGEENVLAYRVSRSSGYLCVGCEERALYEHARRRGVLQWWPVALIVVLLFGATVGLGWAINQSKAPHDPVMSSG